MLKRYVRNRGRLDRGFGTWSVAAGQTAVLPDCAGVADELVEAIPDCELIIIDVPDDGGDLPAAPPPAALPLVDLSRIFPELEAGPPVEVVEDDYADLLGSPTPDPAPEGAAGQTAADLKTMKWAELRQLAKNLGHFKPTATRKDLEKDLEKLLEGTPKE